MTRERLGIFGGTFDPVHTGHMIVAEILREELQLHRVVFLPAGRPPHKPDQDTAADHHRLAMLELAIRDTAEFEVSRIDLDMPGQSYTAKTLEILREQLPDSIEPMFLMGQDSLRDFPSWHEPGRIARLVQLGVAMRPGVNVNLEDIVTAVPELTGRVHLVDIPLIGISSRELRARIRGRKAFHYQVPGGVADYIETHGLYL